MCAPEKRKIKNNKIRERQKLALFSISFYRQHPGLFSERGHYLQWKELTAMAGLDSSEKQKGVRHFLGFLLKYPRNTHAPLIHSLPKKKKKIQRFSVFSVQFWCLTPDVRNNLLLAELLWHRRSENLHWVTLIHGWVTGAIRTMLWTSLTSWVQREPRNEA